MKIMAASDIHGSVIACKAVIDKFNEEKCDRLLLLGDLIYHGPRNNLPDEYNPKNVITMLNDMKDKITAVRGNCDTEVDQMCLDFPIMADYVYLISGETTIFATHGHLYGEDNPPNLPEDSILLTGHTHIACDRQHGSYRYMNPGSPSIPKGGSKPSYIIIENGQAELRRF